MKTQRMSLLVLFMLVANLAFATPKLKCVDVIGDENALLAEAPVVDGMASVQFQDRIHFCEKLENLFHSYIVSVKKISEAEYLMSYSLQFTSGLVLEVETRILSPEESMMIADFVDTLEGVRDEQIANCWLTK